MSHSNMLNIITKELEGGLKVGDPLIHFMIRDKIMDYLRDLFIEHIKSSSYPQCTCALDLWERIAR